VGMKTLFGLIMGLYTLALLAGPAHAEWDAPPRVAPQDNSWNVTPKVPVAQPARLAQVAQPGSYATPVSFGTPVNFGAPVVAPTPIVTAPSVSYAPPIADLGHADAACDCGCGHPRVLARIRERIHDRIHCCKPACDPCCGPKFPLLNRIKDRIALNHAVDSPCGCQP
jgi:hypothetical protein